MALQWFRMYAEFANDPKVQRMPEVMQRRLVMLLCMRCDGDVTFCDGIGDGDVAFHWRISDVALAETKALFIAKGFIDEHWNVLNWNKRQFLSDSSSERTKRYRERKRTSQERHSDGDVTKCDALDTDTDTDTDTEESLVHTNSAELIYAGYPRKIGKGKAIIAIMAAVKKIEQRQKLSEGEAREFLRSAVHEFALSPAGNNGKFTPYCATWMNGERWTDDRAEWKRIAAVSESSDYRPAPKLNPAIYREGL